MATKVNGRYKTAVFLGTDRDGKRKYKVFYGSTANEADFLALEFKVKKKKEEDPINKTLGQAIDEYIESKDAILSPTTIKEYKMIRRIRFQELMNVKITEINSVILQKAINYEVKYGGIKNDGLSPKSIKNATTLIVTVINFFYPDKRIKVTLPQAQKKEYATPDGEELTKIFKAAEGTDIEIPILLAAWLSLRASEICGLKWSDIKDNYIDINEAKVYAEGKHISKAPKTESSKRKIPLPIYIKNKLERAEKSGTYLTDLSGKDISYRFRKLLERNNLKHCRFHDLRHANASIMLQLGIPDKYAQERGGWASNTILKSVYQQTFNSESIKVAERIDNYFESLIKNNK